MFEKLLIKSVELEYVQFTMENKDRVLKAVSELQMNIYPSFDTLGRPCLIIPTPEKELRCCLGHYIIKDPNSTDWCKFTCYSPEKFNLLIQTFGEDKIRKNSVYGETNI